jgi:hypothetical protein
MAVKHQQAIQLENGASIYLPPYSALTGSEKGNVAIPDVYTLNTVQQYALGTIYREGLRTFIYTLIDQQGYTLINCYGGYFVKTNATLKDLSNSLITGVAGASEITLNYATTCAVNKYAGGLMGIKGGSDGVRGSRYIISNTVQDANSYVTFTIDGTLPSALTSGDDFSLIENPYASVRAYTNEVAGTYEENAMYVGGIVVPKMTDARYMWVQTWGPFFMIGIQNSFEGDAPPQQGVCAYHGAGNRHPSQADAVALGGMYTGALQQVGYALPHQEAASTIGEMIFLTIHP